MRPLGPEDLLDLDRYEAVRPALRDAVIAHKRARRVGVGDRVSLVFEDRETLRWQVLEMLRVERIREPGQVQVELDVYNALLPGDGELSATLFLEITNLADIKPELDRLVGLDRHLALVLGDGQGGEAIVRARFDEQQLEEDRISAVQYVRFDLGADARERLKNPALLLRLGIDHPNYHAEAVLPPETRASLALDLEGGRGPLLDFEAARRADVAHDEVIAETPRARATRLARGDTPGHVVIEARELVDSFLDAPPELLAELAGLAQRVARELVARHGSARVVVDVTERPLRWHVAPRKD